MAGSGGSSMVTFKIFYEGYHEGMGEDITIDNTYSVNGGTTWGEWCNTTYIPEEWFQDYEYIVSDNYVANNQWGGYIADGNGNCVLADSVIESGEYTVNF